MNVFFHVQTRNGEWCITTTRDTTIHYDNNHSHPSLGGCNNNNGNNNNTVDGFNIDRVRPFFFFSIFFIYSFFPVDTNFDRLPLLDTTPMRSPVYRMRNICVSDGRTEVTSGTCWFDLCAHRSVSYYNNARGQRNRSVVVVGGGGEGY